MSPVPIRDLRYEDVFPEPLTRLLPQTREVELDTGRGRYRYRVDLDRIRTAADLLGWIEHLSHKTWVKPRHIRELIGHAVAQCGIEMNRGA